MYKCKLYQCLLKTHSTESLDESSETCPRCHSMMHRVCPPLREATPDRASAALRTPGEAVGLLRGRSPSQSLLLSTVPALSIWPALTVLTTHITGNLNMSSTHTNIHGIYIFF